jgi:hypothetical protein
VSSGPPCGNNPNFRLSPGDQAVVEEFMAYLAARRAESENDDQGNEEPDDHVPADTDPAER